MPTTKDLARAERPRASFYPNVVAAALCAVVTLAYASGFAGLIFDGSLSGMVQSGVWAALIGSAVAAVVLAVRSSLFFSLGGPDSNPSAILAIAAAGIAADFGAGTGGGALGPTIFFFLFLAALVCGGMLFLFGKFQWGRYVRFIPHPVVGGFLAGTGYLLVAGAWKMITGQSPDNTDWTALRSLPPANWGFALATGAALVVWMRYRPHYLTIPCILVGAAALFHLTRLGLGWETSDLRAQGLLLPPLDAGEWRHLLNQPWAGVRWDLIAGHAKDLLAMVLVVFVTVLLNATSLDFTTGREVDYDRELKALGLANIACGALGGLVAVNSFNRSLLNHRAGANSRWAALLCAAMVVGVATLAPEVASWLPKPVLAGLVLYLGCSLLLTWLVDGRRDLPAGDYVILLCILGMVVAFGIAPGVLLGVVIACLRFIVTFSKQSVIKQRFDGSIRRSNVERSEEERRTLSELGIRIRGFVLEGHLFFGTASVLLDEIRPLLDGSKTLLLDFRLVRGIDSSAVVVLRKLARLCAQRDVDLAVVDLSPKLATRCAACGFKPSGPDSFHIFADQDRGLEWAESRLLSGPRPAQDTAQLLGVDDPSEASVLTSYFDQLELQPGARLFSSGAPSDTLYLVLSGRVSVQVALPGRAEPKRLRCYGAGTIVGEMGFYGESPRSADVTADEPTRLARLGRRALHRMEEERPALARRLHQFVITTLASRLRTANDELRHLH